jgi:hypothetical protein
MIKTLQVILLLGLPYQIFCANALPDFTAVYDSRKKSVKIKWQHKSPDIATYIIQRSADKTTWTDLALQPASANAGAKMFSFEDRNPAPGQNYYRLKSFTKNDEAAYSLIVMVISSSPDFKWVMYPVPVSDLLTLQYKGTETIKGAITVLLQRDNGKLLTRLRFSSLTTVIKIPVSNLGRGIYEVRIIVENEIRWNQRFIK